MVNIVLAGEASQVPLLTPRCHPNHLEPCEHSSGTVIIKSYISISSQDEYTSYRITVFWNRVHLSQVKSISKESRVSYKRGLPFCDTSRSKTAPTPACDSNGEVIFANRKAIYRLGN